MEYARLITISSPVGDLSQSWLFHSVHFLKDYVISSAIDYAGGKGLLDRFGSE